MARLILVCLREPSQACDAAGAVAKILLRLQPDNSAAITPQVMSVGGIVTGVSDDAAIVHAQGTAVAAGHLVDACAWERPRSGRPDGAFALFRGNEEVVEILSDALASRTVWYTLTDRHFIASTSQRAVVSMLGSFEFNVEAVPWMLAAGTLGPGQSWDRRVRALPPDSCVTLDRASWTLAERTEPVHFAAGTATDSEYEGRMLELVRHAIGAMDVSDRKWAIALSGGLDCRTIISLLPQRSRLRAITWGLKSSRVERGNDALIAGRVAAHFGIEHEYFETDLAEDSLANTIGRFLANGEGCIDHLAAYADGFELWRRIAEAGVRGIIRGDEAFGRQAVRTRADVQAYVPQWSDFPGFPPLESFGFAPQKLPDDFAQRQGETLATWRDRLQHMYRVPCILGALNVLKLPYVEISSPLLSGSIVRAYRELPDHLRTNKALLERIARSVSPSIPFATQFAVQSTDQILKSPQSVRLLRDRLTDNKLAVGIPPEFTTHVLHGMARATARPRSATGPRARRVARAMMPSWLRRRRARVTQAQVPDYHRLAFRVLLISGVARLYDEDAAAASGPTVRW